MKSSWLKSSIGITLITISFIAFKFFQTKKLKRGGRKIPDHVYAYADPRFSPKFEHYVDAQIELLGPNAIGSPDIDSYLASVSSPMDEMDTITFHRNRRRLYLTRDRQERIDERRRLQFGSVPTTSPTLPPSEPFLPPLNTLDLDDTHQFVLVDFGSHVSYNTANNYCKTVVKTSLASVDKLNTNRRTQLQQILEMEQRCSEVTSGTLIDCWIGLRYDNSTTDNPNLGMIYIQTSIYLFTFRYCSFTKNYVINIINKFRYI